MTKLQSISWATILLILSGTNIAVRASTADSQIKPLQIAQKNSDDEMLDTLQERDKKVREGLDKIRKLTGRESEKFKSEEEDLSTETLEALQADNFNIESLEELEVVRNVVGNQDLSEEEMLSILSEQDIKIENLKQLKQLQKRVAQKSYSQPESGMSSQMAFRMLVVGVPGVILLFLIGKPIVSGVAKVLGDNYQEKFGKPKVPEGSINLHARSFKEISLIGDKAERINNKKFGSEEFLLLLRIKINMKQEAEGYRRLSDCVDLLQAGIIAQKSFLRLEQTELRYRSRKQQELYAYVADNLQGEIDQKEFIQKLEKKKAEILPLITTEEGKNALDSYTKELNILGKYELGLKLLALFKQYELQDFSILKNISDVVETLEGKDLVNSEDLISPVLEHYESFEKISPIIGIDPAKSTPKAYAKILQVIGLTNRHGKAYLQFAQLVKLLKQWAKPYKAISLVRKEYTEDKYRVPAEFKEDIPGFHTYQRYAEYLPDL